MMIIELSKIYELNIKESVLDKIFKINTKSLEFKIYGQRRKKFTLHFIEEDVDGLKQELTKLINDYNESKGETLRYQLQSKISNKKEIRKK